MVERLALELEGAASQQPRARASRSAPPPPHRLPRAELRACCAVLDAVSDAVGAALRSFGAHDVSLSPFLQDTSALALLLLRACAASAALLAAHGEAAAAERPPPRRAARALGGEAARGAACATPRSRAPHVSALWRALALRDSVAAGPPAEDAGASGGGPAPSELSAAGPLAAIARCVAAFAGVANAHGAVSFLLYTVTFYANLAHSLTRSP